MRNLATDDGNLSKDCNQGNGHKSAVALPVPFIFNLLFIDKANRDKAEIRHGLLHHCFTVENIPPVGLYYLHFTNEKVHQKDQGNNQSLQMFSHLTVKSVHVFNTTRDPEHFSDAESCLSGFFTN
ncbi:hypothetical protein CapIbe_013216 [Capra ibex]